MPNGPEMRLAYYDAVLSVSEKAINAGFDRMLSGNGLDGEKLNFTIDEDLGKSFEGEIGRPQISFLKDTSGLAKMTFAMPHGTYHGGTVVRRGKQEKVTKDLKDKSLGFNVDVSRIRQDHFTDESFQVEALYLELTKVRNIDTTAFGLDLGDAGDVSAIVQGFVEKLKTETNNPDKRLFLGSVVVPKVGAATGPMRPTSAKFSTTVAERGGVSSGELNFLLMMNNRELPVDATAGIFNGLWTTEGNDATLVISDYLLLDAIALKIVEKNYPGAKFTLTRGKGDAASLIKLDKPVDINSGGDNYCTLEKCDAFVNDKGQVQIDIHLGRWDSCKLGAVDGSLTQVKIGKKQSIFIDIKLKNGDLVLEVQQGEVEDVPPEYKGNYDVNNAGDIVKYLLATLNALSGSAMAQVVMLAMSIKTNTSILDEFRSKFRATIDAMHTAIMLPGAPVFTFKDPHMVGRQLVVGANYIELPKLRLGTGKPFEIGPHPALTAVDDTPSMRTEPKLIGEVAVPFRLVHDEFNEGHQAARMPYYVLRREQYWKCLKNNSFTGRGEENIRVTAEKRTIETQNKKETKSFRFGVEAEANLAAYGQSIKTVLKYEQNFEQVFDMTKEEEARNTYEATVLYPAGKPFAVAYYAIVDRYVLCRNDPDNSLVTSWENIPPAWVHPTHFPAEDPRWPDQHGGLAIREPPVKPPAT